MLTYNLEKTRSDAKSHGSAQKLYVQLYDCIKSDILDGTLTKGERLPSKRELSQHLAVSVITVEAAYGKLVDEGYVHAEAKRGFFVADISAKEAILRPRTEADSAQQGLQAPDAQPAPQTQLAQEAEDALTEKSAANDGIIQLSAPKTPPELFPFATWSRLVRRVLSERADAIMQPPSANGSEALRSAVASHLYHFRGLHVQPEQVVIGAGTEYLYSLILQLLGFQNTIAVENPGYPKIARVYQAHNVRAVPVALDSQGICMSELLKSGANIAHISPSHHFPTGRTTSISRRYELLAWAAAADNRYIIEDDYDAEFRLNGRIIPTLASIDTIERVIYVNTFTKTLSPTLRISYMILPPALMKRFRTQLGFYANTVSAMQQHTLALFMQEGHFESHINRMRRYYREQKDRAVHQIQQTPGLKDAAILEADAGLYFLLRLSTTKSDQELKEAAMREGLAISCLSDFYAASTAEKRATEEHTVIVHYAGLSDQALSEAFARLSLSGVNKP